MNELEKVLNKLCKWRSVFAGWQLGTRPIGDPECDAVRDHREATIILRAEVNALVKLLIDKYIIDQDDFHRTLKDEIKHLDNMYQIRFPGFKSTADGIEIDPELAKETTKNWKP